MTIAETHQTAGTSLPLNRYGDSAVFGAELDKLFRHEWLLVCREEDVALPGDRLGIDIVGEPVMVVRGSDGELRCFSRLCRHRQAPLVDEGPGNGERFTCGYHRWSYRLDGSFIGGPLVGDSAELCTKSSNDCDLTPVPLEVWEGFVFVCLDRDALPLAPKLEPISEAISAYGVANQRTVVDRDEMWFANWKLALENASESYHHLGTHSTTIGPYAPPTRTWLARTTPDWVEHRTALVGERVEGAPEDAIELPSEEMDAFRCFTIFPSTVILLWRGSTNWLSFLPVAPDRTRARTGMSYAAEVAEDERWTQARAAIVEWYDTINGEDRALLERVQAASSARLARPGPLLPEEAAVAEFHRYLDRKLGAT